MSRLIDADDLKQVLEVFTEKDTLGHTPIQLCDAMPTIDAVEVVRCKDCGYWDRETVRQNSNDFKWWNEAVCKQHSIDGNEPHEMWTDADWFCADGEVKHE